MDKIFSSLKTILENSVAFYNDLNDFGLYMFYGAVVCIVLIVFILLFVRNSKTKKDFKIVIESLNDEDEVEDIPEKIIPNQEKLDDILMMRDRLEAEITIPLDDPVETFEDEQEATAVISYDELKKVAELLEETEKIPVIPYPEVKNNTPEVDLGFTAKYKRSDFISPIHGIENKYSPKHNDKVVEFEKTINVEPLNREIKNSVDFLESLKDLRKNLN